jgi:fused signal recognition particle receptor
LKKVEEKRKLNEPFIIAFVGVNGSGKTTTIAKMSKYFQDHNLKTVLVAADTFRAAAIQQLEEHANKLGVKIIKQDYGSDPAAVAFDGIAYAKAKNIDVVLIDTAGRLHSNTNLMDEMKKIMRVAKPDVKIFIGESITGNDCVEQAQQFDSAVNIDGIVLSKVDVDEKGGAAISVSYVTGKPILFFGNGQTYESLQPFDKDAVLRNLGLV